MMTAYQFSVIIPMVPMTPEEILDATDALGNAGCTDASIRGHADGIELLFERISRIITGGYFVSDLRCRTRRIPGLEDRDGTRSHPRVVGGRLDKRL